MIFSGDETTDLGVDTGSPVSDDYSPPDSTFDGRVRWVQLDIADAAEDHDHLIGSEERLRIAMSRPSSNRPASCGSCGSEAEPQEPAPWMGPT